MIQKLNVHFADGKVKGVQKLDDVQHDATAHGCDEHAYCDFCDAACETVMSTVALDMWGEQRWIRSYNRMGSGPMALEMLSDAHHMCETIETSVSVTVPTIVPEYSSYRLNPHPGMARHLLRTRHSSSPRLACLVLIPLGRD